MLTPTESSQRHHHDRAQCQYLNHRNFILPTLLCKPCMGLSSAHISTLSNTLVSSGCVRRPQGKVTSYGLKSPHHGGSARVDCTLVECVSDCLLLSHHTCVRPAPLGPNEHTMWHGQILSRDVTNHGTVAEHQTISNNKIPHDRIGRRGFLPTTL